MTANTSTTLGCGKTIAQLSDYLDAGGMPPDRHIDTCPECLNALAGLDRVAQLSRDLLTHEALSLPAPAESWFTSIIANITREVRAGRSLPLHHDNPQVALSITEGAVRALVRSVGDDIDGVVIGRCQLDGDAETLDAPVEVTVTASVLWGSSIQELSSILRTRVRDALQRHTHLHVTAVHIIINDLHGSLPDAEATA